MTKRAMIALAASVAFVPGALSAQAVPIAVAAQQPAPVVRTAPPVVRMRHGPILGHPGQPGQNRRFVRFRRGATIPHFWFGPQFHIQNWGLYGFPQPFAGGRWIRHYDDAYLIDRDGRVRDGRYGMDWDRYGERWDHDEAGIPIYAGDGDYEPDDHDYEWAERYDRDHRRGGDDDGYDDHGYGHHGGDREVGRVNVLVRRDRHDGAGCDGRVRVEHRGYERCGPPPPPSGGCGVPRCGQGYGWYGWGPVLVTETIVTTAPVVEMRTYYETVTERVRVAPRKVYRAPALRPAKRVAPRPRPGERG
jgi:Ni/Co efflux regulator RcnB